MAREYGPSATVLSSDMRRRATADDSHTCIANSRVGQMTRAPIPLRGLKATLYSSSAAGMRYASVFPDPARQYSCCHFNLRVYQSKKDTDVLRQKVQCGYLAAQRVVTELVNAEYVARETGQYDRWRHHEMKCFI